MKILCLSLWFVLAIGTASISAQSPAATPLPATEPEAASSGVCPECKMDISKCEDHDAKSTAADKDQAGKQAEAEKAVVDLEAKWCEAEARHDAAYIEKVEADGFTFTDSNGKVTTKKDEVEEAKQGGDVVEFKLSDMKAHAYGNTVVLTGQTTFPATDVDSVPTAYRWTDVFVRQSNGEWQVVASHSSGVSQQKTTRVSRVE